MVSKASVSLALLLSAATNVQAVNDWTKPCFQGSCSYDVTASNASIPASLKIWGSSNAISDVTQAGGWIILDCNQTSSNQDIRLVCKSDDPASVGCDHLSQNGAEDTIVRLPDSCGRGPFARVARAWMSENQTIPKWAASQIHTTGKRSLPQVHALTLDNKFSASTGSKHGPVSFSLVGTSAPTDDVMNVPQETTTRRGVQKRGLFSSIGKVFGGIKSAISNDVSSAENAVSGVVKGVKSAVSSVNHVNINKSKQLAPIDVDKSFNIATANVDCGGIGNVQFKVDADIKAHADVSLGVVAAGTIIPPKVTTFSLTSGVSADINGAMTFVASASGSPVDTGEVQLFTVGIPGLDIPDVIQVGPAFAIKGRANMDVSIEADMTVAIAYSVKNAAFAFPPIKNALAQGTPTPASSPLSLSVSPNITAKGSLSAHIIPELNFGISALGGVASATVFLNLDSSATLDLTLSASGGVFSTNIAGRDASTSASPAAESDASENDGTSDDQTMDSDVDTHDDISLSRRGVSVNGCVDMKLGVDAEVGAEGSFFGLFDVNKNFSLFSKDFELFQKCFGTGSARRSITSRHASRSSQSTRYSTDRVLGRRGKTVNLACPIKAAPKAESVVAQTIPASSIHASPK